MGWYAAKQNEPIISIVFHNLHNSWTIFFLFRSLSGSLCCRLRKLYHQSWKIGSRFMAWIGWSVQISNTQTKMFLIFRNSFWSVVLFSYNLCGYRSNQNCSLNSLFFYPYLYFVCRFINNFRFGLSILFFKR